MLGEYWHCVVQDRDTFCPDMCKKYGVCKEMSNVFEELQDAYFFYLNSDIMDDKQKFPYQPVLWKSFTSVIDRNNKKIRIEIGKSWPNQGLLLHYGKSH